MTERSNIYILLQGEAQVLPSEKLVLQVRAALNKKVKEAQLQLLQQQQKEEEPAQQETNLISKLKNKFSSNESQNQDQKQKTQEEAKVLQVGECFGQYYNLTGNKWRPSYVMATQHSTLVLKVDVATIDQILTNINSSESHKQLLEFLGNCIGGFNVLSAVARDKIARSFAPKTFVPGMKIITEGEPSHNAYIIKEGDCMIVSGKNPLLTNLVSDKVNKKDFVSQDQMKKGYMSKSTNIFQLGVKGPNQWIGEDILIFQPGQPFYFSVVAQTRVTVMEISKADMLLKLPTQFVKHLEKTANKRKEWVFARMLNIQQTVKSVVKKVDDINQFETEKEKKLFKQKKTQFIENQLRVLTYQSQKQQALDQIQSNSLEISPSKTNLGNNSVSKDRKRTINLRLKKDLMIMEQKKDDLVPLVLPQIPQNPRDKQMLKNMSRKSLTTNHKTPRKEEDESPQKTYRERENYHISMHHTPHKKKNSEINPLTHNTRSPRDNTLEKVDNKSVYYSQARGNQSSIGDLSMYEEGVTATASVIDNSRLSNYATYTRKVGLLNAKTLKPYSLIRRRKELVPIFYQKSQQKTNNLASFNRSIDRSQESIEFDRETNLNKESVHHLKNPMIIQNQYESVQGSIQNMGKSETPMYYFPQSKAIEPSLFEFELNSKTPSKKVNKAQKKILKDVKKNFNSFMIGRRKITEIDRSVIEKNLDNGLAAGYSINVRADSRQSTPNPWKEHKQRQIQKDLTNSQLNLMRLEENQTQSQLSLIQD